MPEPGDPDALENSNFWTDMWGEIITGKAVPDAVDEAAKRAIQTFQQFGAKGA